VGNDPSDSKLCLLVAVLDFDLVSNPNLALATSQLHPIVGDIESMRKMDIFLSCDPDSPQRSPKTGQ
jgi:hypothetical protein